VAHGQRVDAIWYPAGNRFHHPSRAGLEGQQPESMRFLIATQAWNHTARTFDRSI
jgi:hypothetical protein